MFWATQEKNSVAALKISIIINYKKQRYGIINELIIDGSHFCRIWDCWQSSCWLMAKGWNLWSKHFRKKGNVPGSHYTELCIVNLALFLAYGNNVANFRVVWYRKISNTKLMDKKEFQIQRRKCQLPNSSFFQQILSHKSGNPAQTLGVTRILVLFFNSA